MSSIDRKCLPPSSPEHNRRGGKQSAMLSPCLAVAACSVSFVSPGVPSMMKKANPGLCGPARFPVSWVLLRRKEGGASRVSSWYCRDKLIR